MKKKLLIFTVLMTMAFAVACADEGDYYDGFLSEKEEAIEEGDSIPAGGQYTRKNTGKIYTEGQKMPKTAENGDVYSYGDYVYTMKTDGWGVTLNSNVDKTEDSFEDMLELIAEYPIVDLADLYKGCTNMTASPKIPSTVKVMTNTFYECAALATAPELPAGVEDIQYTFYGCTSLTKAPVIPDGVKLLKYTFHGCVNLTEVPELPSSITNMAYTFCGCTSLSQPPKTPEKLITMGHTYEGCVKIVNAPEIPETVTDLEATFKNCTGLKTATPIPEKVKFFIETFYGCTSLTGTVVINTNTTYRTNCFTLVNFKQQGIEVTGSSNAIDKFMESGILE
ncbi:MAG: leucine-rich repeat domain-containing protein [Lachnospiraceae bacterium]|nr:leucine-rich repeat domain-containing protein [Lachnospiraceae bacterium]